MLVLLALIVVLAGRARDVQAHMMTTATVDESFENSALGGDANDVGGLYAERRRLATRKVAFGGTEARGRRLQIIVPTNSEERISRDV